MPLTFRKRIKILPGLHVNISQGGVSYSAGPRGCKFNVSKRGITHTASARILGVSVSDRRKIADWKQEPEPEPIADPSAFDYATLGEAVDYGKARAILHLLLGIGLLIAGATYGPIAAIAGVLLLLRSAHYGWRTMKIAEYRRSLIGYGQPSEAPVVAEPAESKFVNSGFTMKPAPGE